MHARECLLKISSLNESQTKKVNGRTAKRTAPESSAARTPKHVFTHLWPCAHSVALLVHSSVTTHTSVNDYVMLQCMHARARVAENMILTYQKIFL